MSKNIPWMGLENRLRNIYINVLHLIFSFYHIWNLFSNIILLLLLLNHVSHV